MPGFEVSWSGRQDLNLRPPEPHSRSRASKHHDSWSSLGFLHVLANPPPRFQLRMGVDVAHHVAHLDIVSNGISETRPYVSQLAICSTAGLVSVLMTPVFAARPLSMNTGCPSRKHGLSVAAV